MDETLFGRSLVFLVDPEGELPPLVVHPQTDRPLVMKRAAVRPEDGEIVERYGHGPLQRLYDAWQGKIRPNAEPGFGLPEIFALLCSITGRPVPSRDSEAARIHRMWRALGPLPKRATERVLQNIHKELGAGRALEIYLDAFERRIEAEKRRTDETPR